MRTIYFLSAIASFAIFGLAGCGMAPTTNIATNQNTAGKTNTAAAANDAPAGPILKPADVSPDKAISVIDLINSVAANNDGWKGKEVDVTGYVSATSGSGQHQLLTIINGQTGSIKLDISCAYQGDMSAVFSKPIEVKGKISYISTDGEYKSVNLEPCELKK